MDDQINKSSPEHFVWNMSPSDVYQTDIPSFTNQNDLDRSRIEFSSKQRSDLFSDISKLALFFNWLTRVETLKSSLKNLALRKNIAIKDQDGLIEFPKRLNQDKLLNLLKYFGLIKLSKLRDVHNLYEQLNRHNQNKKLINLQTAQVLFERYNLTNLMEPFELTSLTIKYGTGTGFLTFITDTKEIFNLPNLLKLTLTDCKKLTSLEKIGNLTELLPGLTELILTDCHGLKSLVGIEKLANRSNLISLTLKQCYTLESLATSIENLQPHQPNLLKLELLNCLALPLLVAEEVEKIFKLLPQLKDLTVSRYNPSTSLKKVKEVKKTINVINNRPNSIIHQSLEERWEQLKYYLHKKHPELSLPKKKVVASVKWPMPNLTKRSNQEEQTGASLEPVLSDREEQLIDLTSTGCSDSISPIEVRKEVANAQSVVLPLKLRIKNMKNKQEWLTKLEINKPTARSMSNFTKWPKQEEQSGVSLEPVLSDREEQLIDLTSTGCGDSISPIEVRKEVARSRERDMKLQLTIEKLKNKQKPTRTTLLLSDLTIEKRSMPKLRPAPTGASLGQALAGWASNRSMPKLTKRPNQDEQSSLSDPPCKRQKECFTNGSHVGATGGLFPLYH